MDGPWPRPHHRRVKPAQVGAADVPRDPQGLDDPVRDRVGQAGLERVEALAEPTGDAVVLGERREGGPQLDRAALKAAADAEKRGWALSEEKNLWYLEQLKAKGMSIEKPSQAFKAELQKVGGTLLEDWLKKAGPEGKAVVDAFRK